MQDDQAWLRLGAEGHLHGSLLWNFFLFGFSGTNHLPAKEKSIVFSTISLNQKYAQAQCSLVLSTAAPLGAGCELWLLIVIAKSLQEEALSGPAGVERE